MLSSELATLLTGRYIAINVHPYSFKEYTLAFNEEHNIDRLFRQYMNSSSFPEAVTLSKRDVGLANEYLRYVYETVVIKDIAQRYKLRNIHNLHRIISFVFDSVGSYISPTNIAIELINSQRIFIIRNQVFRLFSTVYVLYPRQRYDIKGRSLLTTNEKYYRLIDLGLKHNK